MSYRVCEIFYSLQGEGAQAGRPAVFCRFAGCNLACAFCDTNHERLDGAGGGVYDTPAHLVEAVTRCWRALSSSTLPPLVVCTGGEPLLQLDVPLITALHDAGYEVAVETNGTVVPPVGIDWLCVSPKSTASLVATTGDELKLLYPLPDITPEMVAHLPFRHYFLQPIAGTDLSENTRQAIAYCLQHPQWRLSVQLHKLLDIP